MTVLTPAPPAEAPARADLCRLPAAARHTWVEQIRVVYPRWHAIREEIRRCHAMNTLAAEPQCLLVIGPSGTGKTTLTQSYAQNFAPDFRGPIVRMPILQATIPSPATISLLVTTLLHAIGDPRADQGTIGSKTCRLPHYIQDCRVELLILDELQHFVDRDSLKVLNTASNWLKTLIKETRTACVLVGLAGEAERVVDANPQLARLFGDPQVLAPFEWDPARPATQTEFVHLLTLLEARLPLAGASQLAAEETAFRCFVAADGLLGYLMALIRRATHLALDRGQDHLDQAVLAEAFVQRLAPQRRHLPNPFVGPRPLHVLPRQRAERQAGRGAPSSAGAARCA